MITLAKAAKTSMRRIVRRDKGQKVVAEAPKDAEPQSMFSRFRRPSSKVSKSSDRVATDAATISLPATSAPSVGVARKPRKGMRTAVNKIKQHVSETLERLRGSLRGAQKNLTSAVAKTIQLEQQAEQLGELMETAQNAAASARDQAASAAAAVGVLEHLEHQLNHIRDQLQGSLPASPQLQAIEQTLKEQHNTVMQQKMKVKEWYTNAAEAQAVQERATDVAGGVREGFAAAQNELAAAASALYEAQRAALAAKQMIIQAVSRAHLDEVREETRSSLEPEQLVLADRENDVIVVGHVSLSEKLKMEQREVWQDVPAELASVYGHSAVVPQREDYEAAKQAAVVATHKREMVALLAEEVATLASGGNAAAAMLTSRSVREQMELELMRKEEFENKVRYLTTRLNWVRMAASRGAADDHPWVANTPVLDFEVDNDAGVVAAREQLHIAKADLLASERKLASLDCTSRLQAMYADIEGRNVPEGQGVTHVAAQLMKDAVLAEIRAYCSAKYSQQAVQEACDAVLKGQREANGQVLKERTLSLLGLEPKRMQYLMHYMDTLPKRLSSLTRPRATTPAPTTPPRASPPPLPLSLSEPVTPSFSPTPADSIPYTNGATSKLTNGVKSTNKLTNGVNGTAPANGFKAPDSAVSDLISPLSSPSNGTKSLASAMSVNGSTLSRITTPSVSSPQNLQSPDSGSDIARVRAALKGFLGADENSPSSSGNPSFERPGRLGQSRSAHLLAGTSLEVAGATAQASSMEAVLEVDSALLDSVRTRLALAQLLERGDNKVVRELYMSQLAADNAVGMSSVEEEVDIVPQVEAVAAVVDQEASDAGLLSEDSIDRVRHYYALQYLLERAVNSPSADKPPSPPPTPRNITPPATKGLTSFALSNFSDDSGSESGDSVQDDVDVNAHLAEEVAAFTTAATAVVQPAELAQALSAALVNGTTSSATSEVVSAPAASLSGTRAQTASPASSGPKRVSKWVITIPRLVFTFKNPKAPTWDEITTLMQERGELTGSLLALTFASWGGLVGHHMDAAAFVSTVYLAAGVSAMSAINTRSQEVAALQAAKEGALSPPVAEAVEEPTTPMKAALRSVSTATSVGESDAESDAAEYVAISPTASDAASFATAESAGFDSLSQSDVESVAGSLDERVAEDAEEEVKGGMWQRAKTWFTRVNSKRPELTGSVMALALSALGCVAAPNVHQ